MRGRDTGRGRVFDDGQSRGEPEEDDLGSIPERPEGPCALEVGEATVIEHLKRLTGEQDHSSGTPENEAEIHSGSGSKGHKHLDPVGTFRPRKMWREPVKRKKANKEKANGQSECIPELPGDDSAGNDKFHVDAEGNRDVRVSGDVSA